MFARVRVLDLSNNFLGYSDDTDQGSLLPKSSWCPSNWEPAAVDTGVGGSLEVFDISSNGLTGVRARRGGAGRCGWGRACRRAAVGSMVCQHVLAAGWGN